MNWLAILTWGGALVCVACGVISVVQLKRQLRSQRRLQAFWATEAPPVDPVDVVLKTGETVTVAPTNVHRAWVWEVRVPANIDQVEELVVPHLPPYTSITPIPREFGS